MVEFIYQHGSRKLQDTNHSQHTKYKISMCRDLTLRGSCPRGTNCTFAHSNEELEKYRAKNRKTLNRLKEHRIENQSPTTEKLYTASDEYYSISNTATVSPVPMPPIPLSFSRIAGYDIPFNAQPIFQSQPFVPPPPPPPQQQQQQTHEIYTPPQHQNVVLASNGAAFYPSTRNDYQNLDITKQQPHTWECVVRIN